jgi:hypothetical protein
MTSKGILSTIIRLLILMIKLGRESVSILISVRVNYIYICNEISLHIYKNNIYVKDNDLE